MKQKFLVLDVEGAGAIESALVYDVGGVVTDSDGTIYEGFSFLVKQIINNREIMNTAYYRNKLPIYDPKLASGTITKKSLYNVREHIKGLLSKYNIKEVFAYNAVYDRRALNNTQKHTTSERYKYFLPYGIKVSCIWYLACQVICTQKAYYDFCIANEYITEKGNIRTTAEIVYSYITKSNFEEEHTGYEDAKIESAILAVCFKKKKKMKRGINPYCWRIAQKYKKKKV